MAPITLKVNGKTHQLAVDPETPLLWVLRDHLNLTGTKYSCGISECGACTVMMDNQAIRSCVTTAQEAQGHDIVTIEGLELTDLKPLQDAWISEEVSQCGYCQPGQLMTAAALLRNKSTPSQDDIDAEMSDVLCRCGTYLRIRTAVAKAAKEVRS
jgi:aerobic-type carbon monoxide dehydrogenase small subunit (CoxS/CutS family)